MDLADLVLELFLAAQQAPVGDGPAFERAFVERLHGTTIRIESVPGGARLYGFASQSGLAHQLDVVAALADGDVIVELKAHRGAMPKNELLRFKAATDDYLMGLAADAPSRPIYRVFGGPGHASRGMRRYAALHGIALVEGGRWPSLVLAGERVPWSVEEAPSLETRRSILALVRPMQEALRPIRGGYFASPWARTQSPDAILELQDEWSFRLWAELDRGPTVGGLAASPWAA